MFACSANVKDVLKLAVVGVQIVFELPSTVYSVCDCPTYLAFGDELNNVHVALRDSHNAPCTHVRPNDVCVEVMDVSSLEPVFHDTTVNSCSPGVHVAFRHQGCAVHVRVYVCGVLLMDLSLHKRLSRVAQQHTLPGFVDWIDVNASGTRLVAVHCDRCEVSVYALPDMRLLSVLGGKGDGPSQLQKPWAACFARNDTLLIADTENRRVQHWTLDGTCLGSMDMHIRRFPVSIAACGNVFAITVVNDFAFDRWERSEVWSLSSYERMCEGPVRIGIIGIAFLNEDTLLVRVQRYHDFMFCVLVFPLESNASPRDIACIAYKPPTARVRSCVDDTYKLIDIYTSCIAACTDGDIFVCNTKHIYMLLLDGSLIADVPISTHTFCSLTHITVTPTRLYALDYEACQFQDGFSHIYVFK